jgi:hypothetical protein
MLRPPDHQWHQGIVDEHNHQRCKDGEKQMIPPNHRTRPRPVSLVCRATCRNGIIRPFGTFDSHLLQREEDLGCIVQGSGLRLESPLRHLLTAILFRARKARGVGFLWLKRKPDQTPCREKIQGLGVWGPNGGMDLDKEERRYDER